MSVRKFISYAIFVSSPYLSIFSDEHLDFFEKKIRPIFAEKCYSCHSVEAEKNKKLKGGFYIDMREGLMRGGEGGPAVVPGSPDESFLMKTIRHEIVDMQMPPKNGKLTEQEIADVETWIKNGCVDPRTGAPPIDHEKQIDFEKAKKFWAFRPFQVSAIPSVKNKQWPRNPIDNFVLSKLEEKGIPVANVASRNTLARRAYMNLTGLAPSKEQVLSFVNSKQTHSWEQLVDELLASQHFGERVGRHWLDLARFAESNGYAFDKDRNGAFQYRDFVIQAMNKDIPYDEFIRLQLAGDLMGESHEQLAATGFIAAGPFTSQQTAKERERSRYEQLDDLISTVGTAMMGLSVGCARCHDHKFDPISSNDYYSMITAFEKTGFETVGKDFQPDVTASKKKKFKEAHQPFLDALKNYEQTQLKQASSTWKAQWQKNDIELTYLTKLNQQWQTAQLKKLKQKNTGIKSIPLKVSTAIAKDGTIIQTDPEGISFVKGKNPAMNEYDITVSLHATKKVASIVLEVLADPTLKGKGPGRANNGNFVLSHFSLEMDGQEIKFNKAISDYDQPGYPVANAFDKDPNKSGWAVSGATGKDHRAIFKLNTPIEIKPEQVLRFKMNHGYGANHTIGKFRISALETFPSKTDEVQINTLPQDIAQLLQKKDKNKSDKAQLQNYYLSLSPRQPFLTDPWFNFKTKETLNPATLSKNDLQDPKWKKQTWTDGKKNKSIEGYSYRKIHSFRDYPSQLKLKANGNVTVWLNGQPLLSNPKMSIKTEVTKDFIMKKGTNIIVMKCVHNNPEFIFNITTGLDASTLAWLNASSLTPQFDLWYARYDSKWNSLNNHILDHKKKEPKAKLTNFYRAKKNGKTYGKYDIHHLVRGNSDAKLGRANPGFMEALMTSPAQNAQWLPKVNDPKKDKAIEPRLAFANWITDEKNGAGRLLARVMVNRLWKMHMGAGIVASVSNFGETGDRPTHPELLDWLASQLIKNNWSLKSIHRIILNSASYRQGIAHHIAGPEKDPENTLLWTHRQQRVEGEVIRDRLLQLAGNLDKGMFGTGSLDVRNPRRSVYMTVKRSKLVPFLKMFDAPDAIQGQGLRNETNSAPQSLTLMNSPFVREMCTKFAAKIKGSTHEDLVKSVFWHTLSRSPTPDELSYLVHFLTQQISLHKNDKNKALIDLCQLMVCSNEFVYID